MGNFKENDIKSKVVKFILATNYFYTIVDEIKETNYYKQKVKNLLNQLETELDKIQKSENIKHFYKLANEEIYNNNLELHLMFFELLPKLSSEMLEQFMIDFIKKYELQNELEQFPETTH